MPETSTLIQANTVAEVVTRLTTRPRHFFTTCLVDEEDAFVSYDSNNNNSILAVPSVLFDFLECASRRIAGEAHDEDNDSSNDKDIPEASSPCHLVERDSFLSSSSSNWYKVTVPVHSLSSKKEKASDVFLRIRVQILLQEDDKQEDETSMIEQEDDETRTLSFLQQAFRGRVVTQQSVYFLQTETTGGHYFMIVMIHDIIMVSSSLGEVSPCSPALLEKNTAYRLDDKGLQYQIERIPSLWEETQSVVPPVKQNTATTMTNAPGYERTIQELQTLLQSPVIAARPTGILITGCAGVGKTRLVRAALANQMTPPLVRFHWVSVTDLLQHAAWQSEQEVFQRIRPLHDNVNVMVWDDLQDLFTSNDDDDKESMELRLVKNCLLQVIDSSSSEHPVVFIGICREHQVPGEFSKTNRLEVTLEIPPPTQLQREQILMDWLRGFSSREVGVGGAIDDDDDTIQQWATRLAEVTPGCVAQDLYRLCSDARMRARADNEPLNWKHLRDVAEACVPSQLAMLDVSKPRLAEKVTMEDLGERHQECWKALAGYESVKKRVFRTVVLPWKRFMESPDASASYPPPRGVLFHGPSGCGKTLAAECLGESLGLPMIRVHASDILDKYVGGSEASLRSLFARARSASPCILFMDEIDSIASNRAKDGEEVNVMSRLLSTLLNELDGVSSQSGQMLIVACTNRLDALDAALLRPGRLEEHVFLGYPTSSDIQAILQTSLSRIPYDDKEVDLTHLAKQLQGGWTSARVAGIARDAILSWIRQTKGHGGGLMKSHFPAELLSVW